MTDKYDVVGEKEGFNKLQWSKFVGDEQYVVRSNDKAEYKDLVNYCRKLIGNETVLSKQGPDKEREEKVEDFEEKIEAVAEMPLCSDCHSQMIPGRNGKPYCKPCYIKWAEANKKRTF